MTLRKQVREIILNDDSADAERCAEAILSLIRERVLKTREPSVTVDHKTSYIQGHFDGCNEMRATILEELQ